MTTTESVDTTELRDGDLVLNYGMLIRLSNGHESTSHPVNEYSPTMRFDGEVENYDEIKDTYAVRGLLRSDRQWAIQGNRLARWARVIEEAPDGCTCGWAPPEACEIKGHRDEAARLERLEADGILRIVR